MVDSGRAAIVSFVLDSDSSVWDPIRDTDARILYVSPGQAHDFRKWAETCGRRGDEAIPSTWNEAFDDVIEFLRPGRRAGSERRPPEAHL